MSENQIVVYQPNETIRLDVRLENETVWLTQLKIAELFGVQKAAISKHIRNIYMSGELDREATVSKMETVRMEGGRKVIRSQEFFNLAQILIAKIIWQDCGNCAASKVFGIASNNEISIDGLCAQILQTVLEIRKSIILKCRDQFIMVNISDIKDIA